MLKPLKIVIIVLLFIAVGYIYRNETTMIYITDLSENKILMTLKSKLLSYNEYNGGTAWNISNDNMSTEATLVVQTIPLSTISQSSATVSKTRTSSLLTLLLSISSTPTRPTTSPLTSQSSATVSMTTSSSSSSPSEPTPLSSSPLNPADILKGGNGIIFVETTDRMQPPSLVLCALESAARVYKDRPVVYFMKGLKETNSDEVKKKYFPTFIPIKNIYFFPLRLEEVFAETPLLPWYQKVDPSREVYWTHVSSDGSRLALIWKYGGIYMDSDIISIRQIPNHNFLAAQSDNISSNGVLGFSSHHEFTWKSMEDFARNYQGAVWGFQGPTLFTRNLNTYCNIPMFSGVEDILCGGITFLHPQRFYPISYPAWRQYYEVWAKDPTFDTSYALHLWNYMNREEHKDIVPGSNTLVEHLYQKYCPTTYGDLAEKKSKVYVS